MTKHAKRLILVLIVALSYYIFRAIRAAERFRFGLGRLSDFSLKGGAVSWTQYINITNGEPVAIPVTSINMRNFIGTTEIGTSILEGGRFLIRGRSTTAMPVRIKIPLLDLVFGVQSAVNMVKTGSFKMRLVGDVSSFGVPIPVDQSFNFSIPKFS